MLGHGVVAVSRTTGPFLMARVAYRRGQDLISHNAWGWGQGGALGVWAVLDSQGLLGL